MRNIIDYANGAEDTFKEKRFNIADSLVLSQLSYLRFYGVVPGLSDTSPPVSVQEIAAMESPVLYQEVRDGKSNRQLLSALAESPRFRDTKLAF